LLKYDCHTVWLSYLLKTADEIGSGDRNGGFP
jgi:hypothetical protein